MGVLDRCSGVAVAEGDNTVFGPAGTAPAAVAPTAVAATAMMAHFHGFDLDDRPLVLGLPGLPHEIIPARTTVPLLRSDVGATVVVLLENGDARRPVVVGVLQGQRPPVTNAPTLAMSAQADGQAILVTAEREVVLRCGDASITLTRAGKVIIQGTHIVTRSRGHNKIQGAVVEIN
jgi:hypothetical protein